MKWLSFFSTSASNNISFLSNKYFRSYTQDAHINADLQAKSLSFLSDTNQRCNEFTHLKKLPDISGSRLKTRAQILRAWQILYWCFTLRTGQEGTKLREREKCNNKRVKQKKSMRDRSIYVFFRFLIKPHVNRSVWEWRYNSSYSVHRLQTKVSGQL
jgi:hypothetical protein